MKQRIITSVVAVAILLPILLLSDTVVFPIAIAACALIAVHEMLSCIGLGRAYLISAPLYVIALAMPFLIRYVPSADRVQAIAFATIIAMLFYVFAVLIFSHGRYKLNELSVCLFTVLYVLIGFNSLMYIRDYTLAGKYLYLVPFIAAWVTDIFAYFCGMLFGRGGKHKLIPDVSPKKTVEGSIGGIAFCVLSMLLFGLIVEQFLPSSRSNILIFVFGGIVFSVVAQIGDLSMSVIKRNYGIKDYGNLFPGHGGVLDRFDSVLAVSSVLLVFCTFFNFFS